jgi:hypothetical protein
MRGGSPLRSFGASMRSFAAPMPSGDGRVTIVNASDIYSDTGTSSLQVLASIPNLPSWLTPVGQAYRYEGRDDVERNISFGYLQRDVPAGYEYALHLYHSPDEGRTWNRLASQIHPDDNRAVARMEGSGLYALVASVDIPLNQAGWHLITYPIPESRPVPVALGSIDKSYAAVYGYKEGDAKPTGLEEDPAKPWRVYAVQEVDTWVNDLQELEFGQTYWISATKPITLHLAVPYTTTQPVTLPAPSHQYGQFAPPITFFGPITARADGRLPEELEARIGNTLCGRGDLLAGGAQYRVKVAAANAEAPDCGAPNRPVEFWVSLDGQPGAETLIGTDVWSSPGLKKLPLRVPEQPD